jgi:phosphoglycerol transferase
MIRRVLKARNKFVPKLRGVTRFSTYLLASFFFFLSKWIERNFGAPNLEQILYHIQFGTEGLLDADQALIHSFIKWCVLLPIVFSIFAVMTERFVGCVRLYGLKGAISLLIRFVVKHVNRAFIALDWLIAHRAPIILLVAATAYWTYKVSAVGYVTAHFGPDYFSANYISPSTVKLQAKNPKNLVLIYVESLETTYSNENLFGTDLLASLNALQGVSFESYGQAPGTSWTIAGITATQCGVPLKSVTLYDGNVQGENMKSFLPNATCLGDVLAKLGYHNVFMGGAALDFAGKGKFLNDHQYHEVYGREEWIRQGVDPKDMNGWGLYDDDLFEKAKIKLHELQDSKQPFNLTLLTVDTHHPAGHTSKYCARRGAQNFEDIVKCTSDQLAEFVKFIKSNGYLSNTNVVIIGDHLAMTNSVSQKLNSLSERRIFNSFISAKPPAKNREKILHFDLFPSILEFLGIDVAGNRLGLGFSAFYKSDELPSPGRLDEMNSSLMNSSDTYYDLWRAPQ